MPAIPDDCRLYAIGDIHGCVDLLRQIIGLIKDDAAQHPARRFQLVFLGDYVDRGIHSKATIDFLLSELPENMKKVFIRGNHDHHMLQFLEGHLECAPYWFPWGAVATLASYGVPSFGIKASSDLAVLQKDFAAKVPPEHKAFLKATQFFYELGDYYFVHAGVRAGIPLKLQATEDQMMIRDSFLSVTEDFGKIIVHGHTVFDAPVVRPNRISIDTGAYASGHLTALVLQGNKHRFLST